MLVRIKKAVLLLVILTVQSPVVFSQPIQFDGSKLTSLYFISLLGLCLIAYCIYTKMRKKVTQLTHSYRAIEVELNKLKSVNFEREEHDSSYVNLIRQDAAIELIIDSGSGDIVETNEAAASFYGYSVETLQSMNLAQINQMSQADVVKKIAHITSNIRTVIQSKHLLASGEIRDVEVYAGPINTSVAKYVYAIVFDVTKRNIEKKQYRLSSAVFSSTSEGILITDANQRILDVNQAFEAITGYSKAEVIGKKPEMFQSGLQDEKFYQKMWTDIEKHNLWRGEIYNCRKDGSVFPELLTINRVLNGAGLTENYVAVFSDISILKQTEQHLEKLAHYDQLTDLPNRYLLTDRLSHAIAHAQRSQTKIALVFIDLDRFKHVNDSFGHLAGDELLRELSLRLKTTLRSEDTIARISGDEFVLLIEHVESIELVDKIVRKMMTVFDTPFKVGNRLQRMTASVGISLYPDNGSDSTELLRTADTAMYVAKESGRNAFRYYDMDGEICLAEERFQIGNELQDALAREEFHLVYQPQFDLSTKSITGVEALIRWCSATQGMIAPDHFIPIAEQTGIIREVGAWVLEQACKQARDWLDEGLDFKKISVNVSGNQLHATNFCHLVRDSLQNNSLPPEYLEIEVTESFLMNSIESSIQQLTAIRSLGVSVAIDDFGTGYSSLEYLKKLPIDRLKIDRSFVRDIPMDEDDMAIARTIVLLGQGLCLEVVAEGIETEEQAEFFREQGCNYAQGFLFSRPVNADKLRLALLQSL